MVMHRSFLLIALVFAAFLPGRAEGQSTDASMGSGSAWLDCNGDGLLDLIYVEPKGRIRFMFMDPETRRFVDHTESVVPPEVYGTLRPGMGFACADVNNDGFDDVFITANGPNTLLLANGDGTFRLATRQAGIKGPKDIDSGMSREVLSASSAFFDYDNDGLLDLFIASYGEVARNIGYANQLYHNTGIDQNGVPKFVDVAPSMGMDYAQDGQSNWSLGVAVADYDNDGDQDLYVANDYNGIDFENVILSPGPNILYRNEGDGTFTDVSRISGTDDPGWAMGVNFADYDQDGWLDIYVANFWEDALLRNKGDGTFENVTAAAGLPHEHPTQELKEKPDAELTRDEIRAWPYNSWGTAFIDYDNDGDLDLHVSNGFIPNSEYQRELEHNRLFENNGNGTFTDVARDAGLDDPLAARGAAYGDFNGDGFVDIFVINNDFLTLQGSDLEIRNVELFVNQGDGTFREMAMSLGLRDSGSDSEELEARRSLDLNNWIQIQPLTEKGAIAVGARVVVRGGGREWLQALTPGSYCSQSSPILHFGLGNVNSLESLRVIFADGTETLISNPGLKQVHVVTAARTPVRLFGFDLASTPAGVTLSWQWEDDGDLARFRVSRLEEGSAIPVGSEIRTSDGAGSVTDPDAPRGELVTYALDAIYRDGSSERIRTAEVFHGVAPRAALGQNFPNPFRASTRIPVLGATGGGIRVQVFDISGRLVRTLSAPPGEAAVVHWDGLDAGGRPAPDGLYLYRLRGSEAVRKMLLKR